MGEFNRFVFGAPQFTSCVKDDKCLQEGMTMEFPTAATAAAMVKEVLKVNPDAYAAFRFRYASNGRHVISFGGTGLDGDTLCDPRKRGCKSVEDQLADGIGLYFERKRLN
jgi:hypothetical protein